MNLSDEPLAASLIAAPATPDARGAEARDAAAWRRSFLAYASVIAPLVILDLAAPLAIGAARDFGGPLAMVTAALATSGAVVGQLFLLAIWAALGSEPWYWRVPGTALLAGLVYGAVSLGDWLTGEYVFASAFVHHPVFYLATVLLAPTSFFALQAPAWMLRILGRLRIASPSGEILSDGPPGHLVKWGLGAIGVAAIVWASSWIDPIWLRQGNLILQSSPLAPNAFLVMGLWSVAGMLALFWTGMGTRARPSDIVIAVSIFLLVLEALLWSGRSIISVGHWEAAPPAWASGAPLLAGYLLCYISLYGGCFGVVVGSLWALRAWGFTLERDPPWSTIDQETRGARARIAPSLAPVEEFPSPFAYPSVSSWPRRNIIAAILALIVFNSIAPFTLPMITITGQYLPLLVCGAIAGEFLLLAAWAVLGAGTFWIRWSSALGAALVLYFACAVGIASLEPEATFFWIWSTFALAVPLVFLSAQAPLFAVRIVRGKELVWGNRATSGLSAGRSFHLREAFIAVTLIAAALALLRLMNWLHSIYEPTVGRQGQFVVAVVGVAFLTWSILLAPPCLWAAFLSRSRKVASLLVVGGVCAVLLVAAAAVAMVTGSFAHIFAILAFFHAGLLAVLLGGCQMLRRWGLEMR